MNEQEQIVNRQEHAFAKLLGWLATAVCLVGLGWLVRGLMPAPHAAGPDAAAMAMMAGGGAPLVGVETADEASLNPPEEFIGHVEPIKDVDLRAQIDGYVKGIHFQEGAFVKTGDLLFTIDPESYEAAVSLRRADVAKAQAELDRAERFQKRLEASDTRGITQSDLDTARSAVAQGQAAVQQAEANLRLAEIDLKHTRIEAPIDGRIGRTVANIGDYVSPSLGTLVRIVQTAPIRVVFSVTDRDYLRMRENIADDAIEKTLRIRLRLPTGTIPEETGLRDFENNEMSTETATLPVRVRFANAKGLLVPNGYVTVLVDQPNAKKYPVVSQTALTTDKEGTFLYVVDKDGKAQMRRVTCGTADNGRVEIRSGIAAGERVIVQGVMKTKPGQPVQTSAPAPAAASKGEAVQS
jgi:RND family efflux transporter MFP subunit